MTGVHPRAIFRALAALTVLSLAGAASWVGAQAPAPVTAPAATTQPPASKPMMAAKPPATAKSPQKALDKPLWHELTRPQQIALEPLAGEWDKLETVRKQKWLEIANRY